MPASSPSTSLYTLGKGILSIGLWSGDTPPAPEAFVDVGNCPKFDVEVTEEKLPHYSSRTGTKMKDKSTILETGYSVEFDLDEISIFNLQMFLKAALSGTNVLQANTVLDREYSLKFNSDNPAGPNETWELWKCELSPNGKFSLIGEEWITLSFSGEGLADVSNNPTSPFFNVTFATTTTTTTTTTV